jgi:hypothetical protein
LPDAGSLVEAYSTSGLNEYMHKHNPWANWQSCAPIGNQLPPETNQPFTAFPGSFESLPTVSFVVPDEQNDMHDGSTQQADAWLHDHLNRYYEWAQFHNSLLIVTFDEDDYSASNQIPTILAGPMICQGDSAEPINHFGLLLTLEQLYGLSTIGAAESAQPITSAFYPGARHWLAGDANFDGMVDTLDFTTLAEHFNAADQSWITGDFNSDGVINALDFNALASNFGRFAPEPSVAGSRIVPEPVHLTALSVSLSLRARRRLRG